MTNLEKIQKACIAANPEIMELKLGCELKCGENKGRWRDNYKKGFRNLGGEIYADVWDDFYGITSYSIDEIEILGRPIRLSDVLLAIGEKTKGQPTIGIFHDGQIACFHSSYPYKKDGYAKWNLRQDDLTLQSEDTLAFLANLLT